MTHIVGKKNRSEIVMDPAEAIRRGHELDRMWPTLLPPGPRGATRAPHRVFNEIDDRRRIAQARLLNQPEAPVP